MTQKTPFELRQEARPQAVDRANKEPLPGPLAKAWATAQDIKVSHLSVRPVTEWDFVMLKEINSFLYQQQLGEIIAEPSIESLCEFCFLMTTPSKECRRLLRRGRDEFAEAAISTFFENESNRALIEAVVKAASEQFTRALSTMQTHGPKEEAKEGEVNFTAPGIQESPKTA